MLKELIYPSERHWLFGSAYYLRENTWAQISSLAKKYGEVYGLTLPFNRIAVVTNPEYARHVLLDNHKNYKKSLAYDMLRLLLGNGLLTSEGDEHLSQRRALQPAFHRTKMEEYLPVMGLNTFEHLTRWQHGSVVDMSDEMMRLTLNIALWSFFGSAPEGSVERVSKAMKTLVRLFPLAQLPLPEATRMLFPKFRQAKTDLNIVTETLLANPHSEQAKRALITILKNEHHDQFTDEQLHAHVLTFLLAGHETTALLLSWCWDMISQDPFVQGKLQAEADAVLGDRFPTSEDIKSLNYTRMVVKETLRMRPPAWALGRQAVQDCTIGGQDIKAGSVVLMSQWVTQHDPRFYDSPLQFRPERWSEIERLPFPRYAFFPFGGGNRVCIGEHFAMTEAIAILAIISRHWQILPTQAKHATPKPSVTLRPNKGVKVLIEKRDV